MKNKQKFNLGDSVRISKNKRAFKKGYLPSWSNETFKIYAIKPTRPVTYILQDHRGELLKGGFYSEEISKSTIGDVYLADADKVLKRKGNQVLVRWRCFDSSHDSWIDNKNLV